MPTARGALACGRHDRNADGIICVITQVLPNDASGNDIWFVAPDNNSAARTR
jgi:hypothetical protein